MRAPPQRGIIAVAARRLEACRACRLYRGVKALAGSGHVTVVAVRFGEQDEPAFRRLFDSAYRPLLAYARRRTETISDAEDVVADTLLVAWRRRLELPADDPLPWLYGVARRVLANQRRGRERLGRLRRALAGSPLSPSGGPAERAESREETGMVLNALARLPERDREVLRLASWEELSHEQIAVSLGCSPNAAALRLHRARQRLRKELVKEDGSPGQQLVEVRK